MVMGMLAKSFCKRDFFYGGNTWHCNVSDCTSLECLARSKGMELITTTNTCYYIITIPYSFRYLATHQLVMVLVMVLPVP